VKPQRIPVTLRVPVALKRRLERLARAEGRSINNYIVTALQTAVDSMDVAEAFREARVDVGAVSKALRGTGVDRYAGIDRSDAQLMRALGEHEEPDF
jgi:predicted transcriptional regulator